MLGKQAGMCLYALIQQTTHIILDDRVVKLRQLQCIVGKANFLQQLRHKHHKHGVISVAARLDHDSARSVSPRPILRLHGHPRTHLLGDDTDVASGLRSIKISRKRPHTDRQRTNPSASGCKKRKRKTRKRNSSKLNIGFDSTRPRCVSTKRYKNSANFSLYLTVKIKQQQVVSRPDAGKMYQLPDTLCHCHPKPALFVDLFLDIHTLQPVRPKGLPRSWHR